jgi:hypothetical protein
MPLDEESAGTRDGSIQRLKGGWRGEGGVEYACSGKCWGRWAWREKALSSFCNAFKPEDEEVHLLRQVV